MRTFVINNIETKKEDWYDSDQLDFGVGQLYFLSVKPIATMSCPPCSPPQRCHSRVMKNPEK